MLLLTAMVLVAHLALPWVLQRMTPDEHRRNGYRISLVRIAAGRSGDPYGRTTLLLGILVLPMVILSETQGQSYIRWVEAHTPLLIPAGLVFGIGIPVLLMQLRRVHQRPFKRRPPVREFLRISFGSTAEEVLWRMAAINLLVQIGISFHISALLCVLAFAALHIPRNGTRSVPYQLTLGILLTSLAATGGTAAAILCHISHNIVLMSSIRLVRKPESPGVRTPNLPAANRRWNA